MCNCIEERATQLKEKFYPNAESVSLQNVELLSGKLFSEIEIKLPNVKKPKTVNLLYAYCPFCGKPYGSEVHK